MINRCILSNSNKTFIMDYEDLHLLEDYTWRLSTGDYVVRRSQKDYKQFCIFLHKLVINAQKGQYVDHINGNKLDNRKCNLRICSNAENIRNQAKRKASNCTSKYKGVSKTIKNRWYSKIKYNYKEIYLGSFKEEIDAARAYNEAAIKYFGEFARLNDV